METYHKSVLCLKDMYKLLGSDDRAIQLRLRIQTQRSPPQSLLGALAALGSQQGLARPYANTKGDMLGQCVHLNETTEN
jgi:hypothetical protein